jgi:ubiquinone biosynthesis protein UbiJ
MADPTLLSAGCAAMEAAINSALRYDPGSRHAVGRLAGQVLAVEMTRPQLTFFLEPQPEGVRVASHFEGVVTTRLRGSPIALLTLLRSERLNLAGSGVEVFGSTGLLSQLQRIIRELDIDWEQALTGVTGDVAGHQGGKALRGLGSWMSGRKDTFERLLGEYLSEELNTTPARAELEHFYREVDDLRLATDRLEARLNALRMTSEAVSSAQDQASPGKPPQHNAQQDND